MTDALGQSQVLPYIGELSHKGHEFHLISFEKEERFLELKDDIQILCDQKNIHWYPQMYTKTPPVLSTLKDLRTMQKKAEDLHKEHQFDWVHCRSYIAAMVGQKMKGKWGCKFLFDMRGFWPDERVDGKIWDIRNPIFKVIYRFFKKKERQFLLEADAVVSLTQKAKKEMVSWEGLQSIEQKISVFPCCANLDLFYTNKTHYQAKEPFVLGYVGSIGTWYMLDEMLDFFMVLKQDKPNAQFHFATKDNAQIIYDKAKSRGIPEHDLFVFSLKHDAIPAFIETLDLSVIFILPAYSKMASSPTKLGEIMAMGVPIICNKNVGDMDEVVEQFNAGSVVNTFTIEGYRKALLELNRFSFERAIQGAQYVFELQIGVEGYHAIYESKA